MSELKRCPFCGGEAKIDKGIKCLGHGEYVPSVTIRCCKCRGEIDFTDYDSMEKITEKAIKSWNTRKPMQNIVERLEEEKEEKLREYKEFLDGEDYRQSLLLDKAIEIVKEESELHDNA